MEKLKILLVGQPNVGKSSLLNALVGPRVTVSNYPGTTVEITKAEKTFMQTKIVFEDTPGICSFLDGSEEEKVTKKALFERKVDGVILVADSISLDRSLYMALKLLEAGIPIIIALNFIEDARNRGITIDYERLEKLLHVPLIPVNPLTKKGINKLLNSILEIKKTTTKAFTVRYDDHIEKAIDIITSQIKQTSLPKRFIALSVLEKDEDFYKYLNTTKIIGEAKASELKEHPKVVEDIAITRYGTASFLTEKVIQIHPVKKRENIENKFDNILLHRIWGPVITTAFFLLIFSILLILGNLIQNLFMDLSNSILSSFNNRTSIIGIIIDQAVTGLMAGISIALPYIFLFYIFLGLLEDIGILSRFIINTGRFLRILGLSRKAFIPLALGLGCTAPATTATRVLSSRQEQFHTALFLAFVPCSSRIAIIMGIAGFYGGIMLAISVFFTLFIAALIWAFAIKKVIYIKSEPLLLELPIYRKPLIKNIVIKSWIRMKDFVYIIIPLLAIGGIIYGILDASHLTHIIVKALSPITLWLGLPNTTIIPLFFGFLQKDLTGGMLITSLQTTDISSILTPLQIYTFTVAATIGIPCINALVMFIKEFGFKKAINATVISIIYGLFIAGVVWRIIFIF